VTSCHAQPVPSLPAARSRPDQRVEPDQPIEHVTVAPDVPPAATKPNVVEAPAPSAPLYAAFRTVTAPELPDAVPLHRLWTVTPDGNVIPTLQPEIALLPTLTVTSPWKPPGHVLMVR